MIRRMTADDLAEIDRLEKILFTSPWPQSAYEYEMNGNPFGNPSVLEEDGEIIGYCDWWIMYEHAEIATIGVKPDKRRMGYAQMMLDHIVADAEKNGCETLSLEVRVSNDPAIRLYEKNGFIQVNIRRHYYDDNGEDAYLMVKPLGGNYDDDAAGN